MLDEFLARQAPLVLVAVPAADLDVGEVVAAAA
jgi:hypothetical protein